MPTNFIKNQNIYTNGFIARYVHPKGNDSNSGLDWSNAYATVYGALQAIAGLSVKAKIYIADNTNLHPDGIHGLWLTNDSALYTGSPYWLNSLPLGGTEFVGIGGQAGTNGGLAVTNSLVNNGMPALRIAGTSGAGFTFRNLIFQDRTEIGCDGNGVPGSDATYACSHLEFDHCAFSSNTYLGVASPALISGYSFWMYFRHCEFTPNYYPDPNHGPYVGGTIDAFNVGTHVATLHYPHDAANFTGGGASGLNVTVNGTPRVITAVDSLNGTVTLDSNTGVAVTDTINRIPGNGVGDVISSSDATHVTFSIAGTESNYAVGDWVVFDVEFYSVFHQVQAIDTVGHRLQFAAVPGSVTRSLWRFPNHVHQPERSAILITPGTPGVGNTAGIMEFEHCYAFGGGITYYTGNDAWGFKVLDFQTESDGTIPIGSAVHIIINVIAGGAMIEAAALADASGVDVAIEGLRGYGSVNNPYMSNLVKVLRCRQVTGPCNFDTSNQGAGLAQQISSQGAVGFYSGKVYGASDAARRISAPSAVRASNLASHNPTDWSSAGGTTITGGHPDPFGGNRATRILNPDGAGNHNSATVYSHVGAVAAGEIILAGAWTKPSGVGASNNLILNQTTAGLTGGSVRPSSDITDWEWETALISGTFEASDTVILNLVGGLVGSAGSYVDYYGLTLIRIPAGLGAGELAELINAFAAYPYGAPAGSIAPMADLAIGDRVITCLESAQAGDAPTIAAGANVGASPTIALGAGATDLAANISITTGTGSTAGAQAVISFATNRGNYGKAPTVTLTPTNANAAAIKAWVSSSVSGYTVEFQGIPADGTLYSFAAHVIG